MKAVVTGCAGFIGSHLTERLLAMDWTVLGVDNFAPTYDTASRRRVIDRMTGQAAFEFIEADLNHFELAPHVKDADVVFHLAARPGVRASWADFPNAANGNVLATQRVLAALVEAPKAHLVFASSSSVYGASDSHPTPEDAKLSPISPYGVTKATGEALVDAYVSQYGLNAVSLRYFTVYGPRQRSDMAFTRWIRAALLGYPLPVFGDGTAVRDFTYVADVVDATVAAGIAQVAGHQVFNVAGGRPTSIAAVLDLIAELTGKELSIERQPVAKGDPPSTGGATDRIRSHLGWEPAWSMETGLGEQVSWMKSRL